jgi:hypothetical protein
MGAGIKMAKNKTGSILGLFVDGITHNEEGIYLLERLWNQIGPYDEKGVLKDDPKLLEDLRKFFEFDDSE